MRKITLLFAVFLSLLGVTQVKADAVTDDFTSYSATSSGQTLGENWYVYPGDDGSYGRFGADYTYKHNEYDGADYNYVSGYSSNYNKNVWLVLKKEVSGTVSFRCKMSKNSGSIYVTNKVTPVGDGTFTVDKSGAQSYSITTTAVSNNYDAGASATYVAFCIASSELRLLDVTYTEYVAPVGAALTVKDGATTISSPYAFDFGLATVGTTHTFTLSNPGTATLEGLAVAETGSFGATLSATSIAAGGEATLTITMPAATGSSAITVSNTSGVDAFVINASATVGAYFEINTDGSSQNFGFVAKEATAEKTFTITNSGNAAMAVTISAPEGFSVKTSNVVNVAAKSTADFTIVMSTAAAGAKSGNVQLTFSAQNATSFTIPVTGYVADDTKFFEDFSGNALPDGWKDNTGWTFSDGKAISGMDTQMTLPALTVAAGEKMVLSVNATGNYPELYYFTSTDGGSTWSAKSSNLASEVTTAAYSTVFIEGLAAGNYLLKLQGYHVQLDAVNGFSLNENAPAMEVSLGGSAIATGYADNFGTKVKAQPAAHTYTITNTGTGTLTGTITSSVPGHFTVSESSFSLAKDASLDFELNLVFNATYEDKASVITIHPTNGGLGDVVINASATTKNPETWEEDFESGIPASWINENSAWTTNRYGHAGQAGPGNDKTSALITPRLQATAGQTLQFDVIDAENETYFLKAEYSTDRTNWTLIENFTTSGTKDFTASEDGYYWLRFTGYYTYVDNFNGFKEAPLEHDAMITAQSIPATGNEGVEYTATVTVKEMAGKAEELTAKFFIGSTQYGDDVVETVDANGTKTFTVTFTPAGAISGDAHFTVTNSNIDLTSDNVAVAIAAAPVLDEAVGSLAGFENMGSYPVLKLTYSLKAGWNTIILPFAVNDLSVFGANAKAYDFTNYSESALVFSKVTSLVAQTPYVIYSDEAKSTITFTGVTGFRNSEDAADLRTTKNGVTFQGTYAPIAAGNWPDGAYGVTTAGKIAPGSTATSFMKGFRAYFTGVTADARLSFEDDATGITTIIDAKELNNDGKVFNLNGQQVKSAHKGLYIVNGRKVVVK